MKKTIIIHIDNIESPIKATYIFEQLEDHLVEILQSYNLKGRIEDEITGNTTVFPMQKS